MTWHGICESETYGETNHLRFIWPSRVLFAFPFQWWEGGRLETLLVTQVKRIWLDSFAFSFPSHLRFDVGGVY